MKHELHCRGFAAALLLAALPFSTARAESVPLRLVILGDSLSSGFGVPEGYGFAPALATRLRADGYRNVEIFNGSMPGDTTSDAATRLAADPRGYSADVAIVELGGNDMLTATEPAVVERNLNWIIDGYRREGTLVVIGGMLSKPELGFVYNVTFDRLYPKLATRWGASLYPFFLQGVFGHPALMQEDGIHPNAAGVQRIVAGVAPMIERNLDAAAARRKRVDARQATADDAPSAAPARFPF
ncbi:MULTISPECIES: arylesterase [Methylosinus]|uniref:Arylesterase n=1 Tax=Methylosinus trichosporium (strain ATCC 35070 / NCIMB 11131 / UNIQEM 75 / OB3b) TaxID=595536 RepID=A0A2D2D4U8_METT3|nr:MULTISPECIES: arylesterase [Methylosinus]ATQ70041.1 arylesterase [Methylosinus trichosporium OB3b]OBS50423.1 arylesterase [Methylosinus sp. 3S-1]